MVPDLCKPITGQDDFYCLSFFSNSILTPTVAQTIRSMIGIDKLLFSLHIHMAINSNIRETEYKMIIALFFTSQLLLRIVRVYNHSALNGRFLANAAGKTEKSAQNVAAFTVHGLPWRIMCKRGETTYFFQTWTISPMYM